MKKARIAPGLFAYGVGACGATVTGGGVSAGEVGSGGAGGAPSSVSSPFRCLAAYSSPMSRKAGAAALNSSMRSVRTITERAPSQIMWSATYSTTTRPT